MSFKQLIGLITGPGLALLVLLFLDLDPDHVTVTRTAAMAILMAVWWITEAIPIPATAMLPVALFPVFGIMTGKAVAATYFNSIIFLFIGGFLMALAMQKWSLHRRIALRIILLVGTGPRRIILGFMIATAFLSMWISNTATTMMMVPIAMAVIYKLKEDQGQKRTGFPAALMIGIAYSASIGGIATLIGTPPNLSLTRIFAICFPQAPEITFASWFAFGLPLSGVLLVIAWLLLTTLFVHGTSGHVTHNPLFKQELRNMGKMTYEEKWVMLLFSLMALLWLFRRDIHLGAFTLPGWSGLMPIPEFVDDGTVAIFVSLLLFVIPSRTKPGIDSWNGHGLTPALGNCPPFRRWVRPGRRIQGIRPFRLGCSSARRTERRGARAAGGVHLHPPHLPHRADIQYRHHGDDPPLAGVPGRVH